MCTTGRRSLPLVRPICTVFKHLSISLDIVQLTSSTAPPVRARQEHSFGIWHAQASQGQRLTVQINGIDEGDLTPV